MNKHSLSIIIACLLSLDAYSGIYSGLNLGINSVTIDKDLLYPLEEVAPTSSSFSNAYTNFHGQILAGYEYPFSAKFSTSLEADADLFTGKSRYVINQWFFNESVTAEERLKYGFSLFLLPTYRYNESVRFFVGPGISTSYFAIKAINTAGNVGVSENVSQWLTGGGLKAGAITKISDNLDLLLTYQFTQYTSTTQTQIEPLSDETLQGRYKPYVNTILIGLRVNIPEHTVITK
ncbi:outer membrane protein [Legionella fallonii]|uniref:Uncharacterized protein n=1 Tax=Legionella fallonii LLAP-10 TaxID=1212491 RepID=A0A098G673_9GAMM|nr:outer membrane beta-barrel protein [Legionella fallonii]CEG57469.1 conserved exported protein of unknown function [Legionella fallonii LLAP-10]